MFLFCDGLVNEKLNLYLKVSSTTQSERTLVTDFHEIHQNRNKETRDLSRFIAAIKTSIKTRDLELGLKLHAEAAQSGDDSNIYVANTLVNMYARCGSLTDARSLFDRMHRRDLVSWNVMVLGYAGSGYAELALDFFQRMQDDGFGPNTRSFVAAFKACACLAKEENTTLIEGKLVKVKALEKGMALHTQAGRFGCDTDSFVANVLVDFYANCGSMEDASRCFHRIQSPTVVSWTALVLGYAENGQGEMALDVFLQMQHEGAEMDFLSFVAALKACSVLAVKEKAAKLADGSSVKIVSLERAMKIHSETSRKKCDSELYVASSLVDTYVKCRSMRDARRIFDRMKQRNVVSWNSLILGYAENGEEEMALELFVRMSCEGFKPDARTYVATLSACTRLATKEGSSGADYFESWTKFQDLEKGMAVHARAATDGFDSNIYVASRLIDMYAKYGVLDEARRVFEELHHPRNNVVTWNAMILGYVENGEAELAIKLFTLMLLEGTCLPNARTFVAAFKACTLQAEIEQEESYDHLPKLVALEKGLALHRLASDMKLDSEVFVASSLIDLYAKCGTMEDAWRVFEKATRQDMVLWTALLLGYVSNGEEELALRLVKFVELDSDVDRSSILAGLNLCACLGSRESSSKVYGKMACLEKGMAFHAQAFKNGWNDYEVACGLVAMYAKCGSMADARRVFDSMPKRDDGVAAWNLTILGYAENKQGELGLELFREIPPRVLDAHSLVAALKACGSLATLEPGKATHALACRLGMEGSLVVGINLVSFYGKCGSMVDAHLVFDGICAKEMAAWTALVEGYGRQGNSRLVMELLCGMEEEGLLPDSVTLASVLTACSHGGELETAKNLSGPIASRFKVMPSQNYFVRMVDLLGRANELNGAVEMVSSMENVASSKLVVLWRIILDACRRWKNVEVGKVAFKCLMDLDEFDPAAYILLASTYC